MTRFSFARLGALLRKEWIQVMRDAVTLRIIIAIPIMQLFLFGYAINSDPKHLPAGLLSIDDSKYTRTIAAALANSGYYDLRLLKSESEADAGLARGDLMFVVEMPPDFDRAVDRGETPSVLIDADATDPTAIGNAVAALQQAVAAINRDLPPIRQMRPQTPPFQFVRARALQSRTAHRAQHRARPDLHRADVLDAVRHHAGDHARARARHDGKSAGDAGAARSR